MKRHTKLLIGLLVVFFVVNVQCYDEDSYEPIRRDNDGHGALIVCKKPGPCSCYPENSKLDCHRELYDWKGKNPNPLNYIQTPLPTFYPLTVNMSQNYLGKFDENKFLTLEQRKKIEVLDLSSNQLYDEETTFDSFENLKVLNLSRNNFIAVKVRYDYNYQRGGYGRRSSDSYEAPMWLKGDQNKKLEVLDLSNNALTQFPRHIFFKFPNLKKLILNGNIQLELNYDDYGLLNSMEKLEELHLDGCSEIQSIPSEFFRKFPSLKKLSARRCGLYGLPDCQYSPKLKVLDVGENRISSLSRNSYYYNQKASSIETLILDHNSIYKIEYNDLKMFRNVKILDLRYNRFLSYIDGNAFGAKYSGNVKEIKLEELYLSDCDLKTLDQEMIDWGQLKVLKIRNNWFNCDSSLKWLILDHSLPIEKGNESATCKSPEVFRGQRLHEIKEDDINDIVETSILYYVKKALDYLTRDQPLFFFGTGMLCSFLLILLLRCCYCCLCCCCRRAIHTEPMFKQTQQYDRLHLMEHDGNQQNKSSEEDTQTIAETIPDE